MTLKYILRMSNSNIICYPEMGILTYLEKQNRPYSATDVLNNLHKEFSKTVDLMERVVARFIIIN